MSGTRAASTAETDKHKKDINALNTYARMKTLAEGLIDLALLMANAAQLKATISAGPSSQYFWPNIIMVSLSIVLQIAIAVILLLLAPMKVASREETKRPHLLNDISIILILAVMVLNVFLGAFGIAFKE